jgi:hypothetical protein
MSDRLTPQLVGISMGPTLEHFAADSAVLSDGKQWRIKMPPPPLLLLLLLRFPLLRHGAWHHHSECQDGAGRCGDR